MHSIAYIDNIAIKSNNIKLYKYPYNPAFCMLSTVKSFQILHKKWIWFYSKVFCFELIEFYTIFIQKTVTFIVMKT